MMRTYVFRVYHDGRPADIIKLPSIGVDYAFGVAWSRFPNARRIDFVSSTDPVGEAEEN